MGRIELDGGAVVSCLWCHDAHCMLLDNARSLCAQQMVMHVLSTISFMCRFAGQHDPKGSAHCRHVSPGRCTTARHTHHAGCCSSSGIRQSSYSSNIASNGSRRDPCHISKCSACSFTGQPSQFGALAGGNRLPRVPDAPPQPNCYSRARQ